MKDQTEQVLAQLLERAAQGIDEAVAFSQAQIPDVMEQLLLWKMASSAMAAMVGLAMWAAFAMMMRAHKKRYGDYDLLDSDSFATFIVGFIAVPVGGLMAFCSTAVFVKILIAPKLYLLEYAAELVK